MTNPVELVWTELIPIPFELLIATIWWFNESSPVTGAITFTSDIVWLGAIGCSEELSTTTFLTGLKTIKFGAFI